MATPAKRVRIAFGVNPDDGEPTADQWVEITDYVMELHIRVGRSLDLDRAEAGTCTIVLNNNDARFTPENTAGAHYPNIRPFAQVEVAFTEGLAAVFQVGQARLGEATATLNTGSAATGNVFRGLVERWTPEWFPRQGGICTVECVDLFRYLQNATITAKAYAQQTVGARIAEILTDIANPFPTLIDSSGMTLAAGTVSGNALDYMQSIAALDGGLFYARGDGKIVFDSRLTIRNTATYKNSQATIGDGVGEIPYIDLRLSQDEQLVKNKAIGKIADGTDITAQEDPTSQARFLLRIKDFGTTEAALQSELEQRAVEELLRYAEARLRVDNLEFELNSAAVDGVTLTQLDLLHRVTVKRTPDQGAQLSSAYLVQGMEHDLTPASWRMRLRVSSVPASAAALGEGILGSTFVLR